MVRKVPPSRQSRMGNVTLVTIFFVDLGTLLGELLGITRERKFTSYISPVPTFSGWMRPMGLMRSKKIRRSWDLNG